MVMGRVLMLLLLMIVTPSTAKTLLQCKRQVDELTVANGSSVYMMCGFNWTGPVPEVRRAVWQKLVEVGDPLIVHVRDQKTENSKQAVEFAGRTAMFTNWFEKRDPSLNLTSATPNDTGVYECQITTNRPHTMAVCAQIRLTVTPDGVEATTVPSMLLLAGLVLLPLFS